MVPQMATQAKHALPLMLATFVAVCCAQIVEVPQIGSSYCSVPWNDTEYIRCEEQLDCDTLQAGTCTAAAVLDYGNATAIVQPRLPCSTNTGLVCNKPASAQPSLYCLELASSGWGCYCGGALDLAVEVGEACEHNLCSQANRECMFVKSFYPSTTLSSTYNVDWGVMGPVRDSFSSIMKTVPSHLQWNVETIDEESYRLHWYYPPYANSSKIEIRFDLYDVSCNEGESLRIFETTGDDPRLLTMEDLGYDCGNLEPFNVVSSSASVGLLVTFEGAIPPQSLSGESGRFAFTMASLFPTPPVVSPTSVQAMSTVSIDIQLYQNRRYDEITTALPVDGTCEWRKGTNYVSTTAVRVAGATSEESDYWNTFECVTPDFGVEWGLVDGDDGEAVATVTLMFISSGVQGLELTTPNTWEVELQYEVRASEDNCNLHGGRLPVELRRPLKRSISSDGPLEFWFDEPVDLVETIKACSTRDEKEDGEFALEWQIYLLNPDDEDISDLHLALTFEEYDMDGVTLTMWTQTIDQLESGVKELYTPSALIYPPISGTCTDGSCPSLVLPEAAVVTLQLKTEPDDDGVLPVASQGFKVTYHVVPEQLSLADRYFPYDEEWVVEVMGHGLANDGADLAGLRCRLRDNPVSQTASVSLEGVEAVSLRRIGGSSSVFCIFPAIDVAPLGGFQTVLQVSNDKGSHWYPQSSVADSTQITIMEELCTSNSIIQRSDHSGLLRDKRPTNMVDDRVCTWEISPVSIPDAIEIYAMIKFDQAPCKLLSVSLSYGGSQIVWCGHSGGEGCSEVNSQGKRYCKATVSASSVQVNFESWNSHGQGRYMSLQWVTPVTIERVSETSYQTDTSTLSVTVLGHGFSSYTDCHLDSVGLSSLVTIVSERQIVCDFTTSVPVEGAPISVGHRAVEGADEVVNTEELVDSFMPSSLKSVDLFVDSQGVLVEDGVFPVWLRVVIAIASIVLLIVIIWCTHRKRKESKSKEIARLYDGVWTRALDRASSYFDVYICNRAWSDVQVSKELFAGLSKTEIIQGKKLRCHWAGSDTNSNTSLHLSQDEERAIHNSSVFVAVISENALLPIKSQSQQFDPYLRQLELAVASDGDILPVFVGEIANANGAKLFVPFSSFGCNDFRNTVPVAAPSTNSPGAAASSVDRRVALSERTASTGDFSELTETNRSSESDDPQVAAREGALTCQDVMRQVFSREGVQLDPARSRMALREIHTHLTQVVVDRHMRELWREMYRTSTMRASKTVGDGATSHCLSQREMSRWCEVFGVHNELKGEVRLEHFLMSEVWSRRVKELLHVQPSSRRPDLHIDTTVRSNNKGQGSPIVDPTPRQVVVKCPFAGHGCDTVLAEPMMTKHLEGSVAKHLKLIMGSLENSIARKEKSMSPTAAAEHSSAEEEAPLLVGEVEEVESAEEGVAAV